MSKPASGTGKPRGTANWVATNVDIILELPEPGQEWVMYDLLWHPEAFDTVRADLPERFLRYNHTLLQNGVIHQVGTTVRNDKERNVYETDQQAYEYVEAIKETREELPCEHKAGFETVDAGETYVCGYEFCEDVHDAAAIRQVYGGG